MKTQRIVLLHLVLVFALALTGCSRSRRTATASGDSSSVAPVAPTDIVTTVALDQPTTVPAIPTPHTPIPPTSTPQPLLVQSTVSTDQPPDVADLPPLSRSVNILLLGSDRRPKDSNWRTDVLMLIALDLEGHRVGVISFPRDIYIDVIPGHQPNKINVIDYLGERDEPGNGPDLLASIIKEKTGIPVDFFLRFDFEGFKKVVDALGGVEITVECRVYEYLPEENIDLDLQPGVHRLEGKMALGYVRARNQGGDLERARRQQRVVWAVRNQLLTENQLPNLPALYAALQNSVQTDIGFVDAIRFARFALDLDEDNIHGMVISPPDMSQSGWRGGMSVFVANWPVIAERVQTVFDRPPLALTNTVGAEGDRVQCP